MQVPGKNRRTGSLAGVVELRERYVDALVDGDPAQAAALLHAATSDGIDVRTLYLQVLQPALYEIGRRWEEAEISIAQEHLATATTQSLMAHLAERLGAERPSRRGRIALVASAEGELHSIGARMVADFLEADGWDVLFVGALSPVDALAEMAAARGVDVVALSASLSERLPEVNAAVRALAALEPRPLIAVGGQAFSGDPAAALATGADLYANNPEALVKTLAERF
jgi:methanogenic corrinoid protein MtbC1